MRRERSKSSAGGGRTAGVCLLLWTACAAVQTSARAQQAPAATSTLAPGNISEKPAAQPGTPQPSAARTGAVSDSSPAAEAVDRQMQDTVPHPGVLLDRMVAVVNGDVILESDVAEERRLIAFQPVTDPTGAFTREKAVERLVNRRLLLQQAKLQPHKAITDAEVTGEIAGMRRDIPACKRMHCETDAGWQRFLSEQGVTEAELTSYVRDRMEALAFVELRFRTGAIITPAEIKSYYETSMLPVYAKQHVKAPSLKVLSDRIQEVLLQQRVSGLLADWLKSLRAQGTVQIVADGGSAS